MFRFRPGDGRFAAREGLTVPRRVRVVRGLALDLDVVGDERGARPLNFGGRRALTRMQRIKLYLNGKPSQSGHASSC